MSCHSSNGGTEENTIKLLITSDINLGYEETLQRKQFDDSFITFEEILQLAVNNEVDAVLIAGNLFYGAKPSQMTMIKCINLIRKYCLGPRDLKIQLLSDPSIIEVPVNFEDPNFNVQIPVFCIHGSRDESLHGNAGPLDILSISGLLNYIGKISNEETINIAPLIIKKGRTKLALYGLGYIHEQKVARLFQNEEIHLQDVSSIEELDETFNLLMVHQARGNHTFSVKDNVFPDFLDLVVWGHEHQSIVTPEKVLKKDYLISQPGSTVATSLVPTEAGEKFVGILHVNKKNMKMEKVKLRTVRPFVYKELVLREQNIKKRFPRSEQVFNFLSEYIESELIPIAEEQLTGHKYQPRLPLIKVRAIYDVEKDICDTIGLCRQFCDEIANAMELLTWKKSRFGKSSNFEEEEDDAWTGTEDEKKWYMTVQDRLNTHFSRPEYQERLRVISIKGLNHALTQFVEREDDQAFEDVMKYEIDKCIKYVSSCDAVNEEEISQKINEFCSSRIEERDQHAKEIIEMLHSTSRSSNLNLSSESVEHSSNANNFTDQPSTSKGRGRGRSSAVQQSETANKTALNISITSTKKRGRGKTITTTMANKNFTRPSTSRFRVDDIFDSQNSADPVMNLDDHHPGSW